MDIRPIVFHPIELAAFLQFILRRRDRIFQLVICSSQDDFLHQLLASMHHEKDLARLVAEAEGREPHAINRIVSRPHDLLVPTLHQLATSRNVKITFCATLSRLQAYLSTLHVKDSSAIGNDIARPSFLALVNPIALHKNVASFSAQGLSRTFASAVDAAFHLKAKLIMVECPNRAHSSQLANDESSDDLMLVEDQVERDAGPPSEDRDPWEEQVSILNVTTKSFGAGERGWVGRTVKIKTIAERWCIFERIDT